RFVGVLMAAAGLVSAADLFPLAVGNRWEYSIRGRDQHVTAEVLATETIDGTAWVRVRWLQGEKVLLRIENQRLVQLDRENKKELPWLDFSAAPGSGFITKMSSCNDGALVLADKPGKFSIAFVPGPCRDAGFNTEVYEPEVGLTEHVETSF